jgi:asparagine synthase (glutamine-hydrolysing)
MVSLMGQTLWQNVRRLEAGHCLNWQPKNAPKETRQYQIPDDSGEYTNTSFAQQLDILDQVLDRAIARHAPTGNRYSLFLSGGLDSRMLAGFLHRQAVDTVALTVGKRSDLEMECAIPVARTLGFKYHTTALPDNQYPGYADLVVNWEHLANGCDSIMGLGWGVGSQLRNLAPRVISGFLLDRVIGGKSTYYLSEKVYPLTASFPKALIVVGLPPNY